MTHHTALSHDKLPHATLPHTKRTEEDSPIPAQHSTHHATPLHTEHTEEEPPIPAQHPTPPATHHTHTWHWWERRLKTHTMDIKGGEGGT